VVSPSGSCFFRDGCPSVYRGYVFVVLRRLVRTSTTPDSAALKSGASRDWGSGCEVCVGKGGVCSPNGDLEL